MSLPIKACLQADLDCIFNQQVVLDMKQQGQIPPGLFLHQLYNRDIMPMSTDNVNLHSDVDQSVNDWIARGWLMRFHLPSIQSDFLMTWRDYEQWLHGILGPSPSPLLQEWLKQVQLQFTHTSTQLPASITRHQLLVHWSLTDQDITQLIQWNLLLIRNEETFWFSVPGLGTVIRSIQLGRQEWRKCLWRKMNHEMAEKDLMKRPIRSSVLSPYNHLLDILGSGLAKRIDTPVGPFIRWQAP